ncbi:hypothetical protein [Paenibacillus sp. OV219]|uniref:hypothetical protein n=1 Tax=Paenibacillus sp. OV219 TaxID=1884377 RepID=UPI0008C74BD1|nr:hypothetical protein [Paenibacillus sp. OV219]SEO47738.1 hypothetical protein SAMN05518847_10828 [Paenibacillus sp. OV219]
MMKRHALGITLTILGLTACISTASAYSNKAYEPIARTPDTITVFIDGMNDQGGKLSLKADQIEWYEGKEADAAFAKNEPDSGLTSAPDGYYIVNDDNALKSLEVDPHAVVQMQIYDHDSLYSTTTEWNKSIPLPKLESLFHEADGGQVDVSQYPYHLTLANGKVVQIVQQFIP